MTAGGAPGGRPASEPSFWELVELAASRRGDAVMLTDEWGRHLTFQEYRDVAVEVAAGLASSGLEHGESVAWQLPTTLEAAVLLAALSRLGVVQTPIVPAMRRSEVELIVREVRPGLLVVPDRWNGFEHAAMATELVRGTQCRVLSCDLAGASRLALPRGPVEVLGAPARPAADEARWIFYSSGTTGMPKGVRHSDSAISASPRSLIERARLTADDVYAMNFAVTHIGGPTMLAGQLQVGFRMILVSSFDPEATSLHLADAGLTVLGMAPPFFHAFLAAQRRHGGGRLFDRGRVAISGGTATPLPLWHEVHEHLGAGVLTVWGMTECPIATCPDISDPDELKATTCGRPGVGVQLRIIDADGRDVAPGEQGEIAVRGPQMLVGYVNAALDADSFTPDGFFRSGDLGFLDASDCLHVTGRLKDVIIRNAENISAAELESLIQGHEAVQDVCVIGLPDERTGERVCAVIEPVLGGVPPSLADIVEFCLAAGIARYKVPEQVEVRSSLPRNAIGKVEKRTVLSCVIGAQD